jgi:hypothetical protein
VRWLLIATLAACWTGAVAEPEPEPPTPKPRVYTNDDLEIKFRRTACFGMCPVYEVTLQHDGMLRYYGRTNVAQTGERTRRLTRAQMLELSRSVDHVQFFELDDTGHPPQRQACTTVGGTTTCSFGRTVICSDTSHSIVTVSRPRHNLSHTIDDAHCSDDNAAAPIEQRIEELVSAWVGR